MKIIAKLIEVFENGKPTNLVEVQKIEGGIPSKKLPTKYLEGFPHFFTNKNGDIVLFFNKGGMIIIGKGELFEPPFFDEIINAINFAVNRYESMCNTKVYEWK